MRFRRVSPHLTSACDGAHYGYFAAQPVWRYAASLDAFETHALVGLGEGTHGGEQDLAFRVSLIRDPRFAAIVDDIVVEIGNSRYQDVIDRFVAGGDVPFEELRQVWKNGPVTNAVPDKPVYEAFFRAVRDVNESLPRERRLRILLGEPPIDWTRVRTFSDVVEWRSSSTLSSTWVLHPR